MSYTPSTYPPTRTGPAASSHQSLTSGGYHSGSHLMQHQQQPHAGGGAAGYGGPQSGMPGPYGIAGRPAAGAGAFMGGGQPAVYQPGAAPSPPPAGPGIAAPSSIHRTGSFAPYRGQLAGVPQSLEAAVPPCPRVVAVHAQRGAAQLPLMKMHVAIEVQMTVAFVRIQGTWVNVTAEPATCVFELPTPSRGTVTAASVRLQGGQAYRTAVVDSQALAKEIKRGAVKENAELESALDMYLSTMGGGYRKGEYDPDVFRLPFTDVPPGAQATVSVSLFQDLRYQDGQYQLVLPLTFPDGVLMTQTLQQALTFNVVINTGTEQCSHTGASHPLSVVRENGRQYMELRSNNEMPMSNRDFTIAYSVTTTSILANLIVQPSPSGDGGNFCLFLAPPQRQNAHMPAFPRRIVFVVDNSGSMYGKAMNGAIEALVGCLDMLTPADEFAICVFHENQQWFDPQNAMARIQEDMHREGPGGTGRNNVIPPPVQCLLQATPHNLGQAKAFARGITAGGLTDILHPVQQSFGLLAEAQRLRPDTFAIPVVFLMTDGAVPNEREVCKYVQETPLPARIFTLGIGGLCNIYFLRMLAQIGRGYTASSLRFHTLRDDILDLMAKMSVPLLLDVSLGMQVAAPEVFPRPIPDLFVGSPVVISGKYGGAFPDQVTVRGRIPSAAGDAGHGVGTGAKLTPLQAGMGTGYELVVPARQTRTIPVDKVFTKQRLDLMIAADWLAGGDLKSQSRAQIVKLSEDTSVPCPYTSMVLVPDSRPQVGDAGASGGVADTGNDESKSSGGASSTAPSAKAKKKGGGNMGLVVGAAAGVLVLGAGVGAAVAFGNVGATIANASGVFDGGFGGFDIGAFAGDVADCSCCDSIPCVPTGCGGECGKCWSGHEGALDLCFGNCGDSCQECGGAICGFFSNCFGDVSNCCGSFYSVLCKCSPNVEPPSCCSDCGPLSGCAAGASEVFASIGSCFAGFIGGIGQAAGSMCNTVGDCASGCCSSYGDFCSNLSFDCSGVTGICSGCCDSIGDCAGGIAACAGGAVGCVGNALGGGCGCLGDIAGFCGEGVGEVCDCLAKLQ